MPVRLGIVGCGSFACFALGAAAPSPLVELVAVADPREPWRKQASSVWEAYRQGHVRQYEEGEGLCRDPDVELVWILAPPFLHYPLARTALEHGKAVFLEKPGSLHPREMEELEREAEARGVPVSVDFVLRRTPVAGLVRQIVGSGVLGALERLTLENVAHDENLPSGHWFWDTARSGGIFIEHGVHFFDLANWWCGPGEVQAALALRRLQWQEAPIDRVLAVALHRAGVGGPGPGATPAVATYYHSFTTVKRFERASWHLVLHRGFLEVEGWIPTAIRGEVLVTEEEEDWLRQLPGCRPEALEAAAPDRDPPWAPPHIDRVPQGIPSMAAEGRAHRRRVRVEWETPDRTRLYREAIRQGLEDVAACLVEVGRRPAVSLADARRALDMAARATDLAKGACD